MAKIVREEKDHVVILVEKDNETLWSISKEFLGNGTRWPELVTLNFRDDSVAKHAYVRGGAYLKVPKKEA